MPPSTNVSKRLRHASFTGLWVLLVVALVMMLFFALAFYLRMPPNGPIRNVPATLYKTTHHPATTRTEFTVFYMYPVVSNKNVPEHWTAQVHYEKRVTDCPLTQAQFQNLAIRAPIEISLQATGEKEICKGITP